MSLITVHSHDRSIITNEKVSLQTDLNGNIYLKHNNEYYIVSLDPTSCVGIELTKIKNPKKFRENLMESGLTKASIDKGTIRTDNITLRGRAYDTLNTMSEEERADYMDKNEFIVSDDGCKEKRYFWVDYKDEQLDEIVDDGFWLNGIDESNNPIGMEYSDLLFYTIGTFETIMIHGDLQSQRVLSSTEKKNGYCINHLIVYTDGKFKANFFDSHKIALLCFDPSKNELILELF
jgi:hypothetical protein